MREKNKERRPSILNHYSTKNTKASTVTVKKCKNLEGSYSIGRGLLEPKEDKIE